jgi:hypothetical protein
MADRRARYEIWWEEYKSRRKRSAPARKAMGELKGRLHTYDYLKAAVNTMAFGPTQSSSPALRAIRGVAGKPGDFTTKPGGRVQNSITKRAKVRLK